MTDKVGWQRLKKGRKKKKKRNTGVEQKVVGVNGDWGWLCLHVMWESKTTASVWEFGGKQIGKYESLEHRSEVDARNGNVRWNSGFESQERRNGTEGRLCGFF